jgi:hypothetical protein
VANLLEKHDEEYPETNGIDILVPSLATIDALDSRMTAEVKAIVTACRELLSQSPNLIRIFHARRLLTPNPNYLIDSYSNQLFRTRIALDLSWNDLLRCICSLRALITYGSVFFHTLFLFVPALCQELDHLYPIAMVSRDLACGMLQLMQQIVGGEQPMKFW